MRLVVSLRRLVTAVGAGQAVLEIAAQYAAEHAREHAIQLAQSSVTTIARTNAQAAKGSVPTIARQDAKQIASRHAQQIVQTLAQTVQVAVETVALRPVLMTAQVDANNVDELIALIEKFNPDVVLNLALPYQDLTIMDACLATKTHYIDTANYEPEDTAKFEYKWQWAYREKFKEAGITALLGSGFDPGVTGVFSAYALKHEFDEINYIDILDCNGGDHGYPFATNFNPEINIREVSANGSYWEDGHWVETKPMEIKREYDFDGVGMKDMYLLHHEEIESLALNMPGIKRIRFFMTFGQSYLTHLKCLENVGMTSIEPIMYEGKEIVPLQFLKAVLPDPASLGPRTVGKTNIGCIFQGKKDGKEKKYYLYNICDHQECYKEVGSQAISYTTGVPAMIGAMLVMNGTWQKPGVYNIEEFDPDPFMDALNKWGLPWKESWDPALVD